MSTRIRRNWLLCFILVDALVSTMVNGSGGPWADVWEEKDNVPMVAKRQWHTSEILLLISCGLHSFQNWRWHCRAELSGVLNNGRGKSSWKYSTSFVLVKGFDGPFKFGRKRYGEKVNLKSKLFRHIRHPSAGISRQAWRHEPYPDNLYSLV